LLVEIVIQRGFERVVRLFNDENLGVFFDPGTEVNQKVNGAEGLS
jgi:hypothetical protein